MPATGDVKGSDGGGTRSIESRAAARGPAAGSPTAAGGGASLPAATADPTPAWTDAASAPVPPSEGEQPAVHAPGPGVPGLAPGVPQRSGRHPGAGDVLGRGLGVWVGVGVGVGRQTSRHGVGFGVGVTVGVAVTLGVGMIEVGSGNEGVGKGRLTVGSGRLTVGSARVGVASAGWAPARGDDGASDKVLADATTPMSRLTVPSRNAAEAARATPRGNPCLSRTQAS